MANLIQFSDIYKGFDSNMQALYELHVAIEETFGAQEWEYLRNYYGEILPLFGENKDPSEIQAILERLIKIDVEDNTLDFKKVWNAMNVDTDDVLTFENGKYVMTREYQNGLKVWAEKEPESANRFFRAFLKTQRQSVFKSELSRQGLLLSAVSQFEFLMLHLLRAYFARYETDVMLPENYSIEDLDEAICQKLEKKNIKHVGIDDKINFLTRKYPLQGFNRAKWQEIVERRNVFTHRSGRADDVYVKTHKSLLQTTQNVNVGERLRISRSYIKDAIEYLHLWGLVLCQKVWEKSGNSVREDSREPSNTLMQFIRDERYAFGGDFSRATLDNIQFKSYYAKEVLMINYAICADKLGRKSLKTKLLSRIRDVPRQNIPVMVKKARIGASDEPLSIRLLMAKSVLEGNKQHALDYMERAADTNEITFLDLDYWVIFDYLRDDPRFQEIQQRLETKIK